MKLSLLRNRVTPTIKRDYTQWKLCQNSLVQCGHVNARSTRRNGDCSVPRNLDRGQRTRNERSPCKLPGSRPGDYDVWKKMNTGDRAFLEKGWRFFFTPNRSNFSSMPSLSHLPNVITGCHSGAFFFETQPVFRSPKGVRFFFERSAQRR